MNELARTGVQGLDNILGGGLPRHRIYLLQGDPGTGKTTAAMQFLLEGVRLGERCLYVTLSETKHELEEVAASHGWSIEGVHVYEMSSAEGDPPEENTLYVPAEVELSGRMKQLLDTVDAVNPSRIVIDSCSELRLLAQTPLRFRRQLLALKEDLVQRRCTILLLENPTTLGGDTLLQSLVHGVINLEQLAPIYGSSRRRVRVMKLRGVAFRGGFHDLKITTGGMVVFPRLVAAEHHHTFQPEQISSGVASLDELVGGGIDRGTSTLVLGPAGSGKSALTSLYACAVAARGEHAAMYCFEEGLGTLFARADGLGLGLRTYVEQGLIRAQQIDPAELAPGEFVHRLRESVERDNVKLVVIDSLNGYLHSMPEEQFLVVQLHELLSYLRQRGTAVMMVVTQQGVFGSMPTPVDVTYLADAVILTRYFEAGGRVRKALSVLKKRSGQHQDSIRELTMSARGLEVSEELSMLHGVLTGVPEERRVPKDGA